MWKKYLLQSVLPSLNQNLYDVNYDVYGLFKLLVFERLLSPASKWAAMQPRNQYYFPVVKGEIGEYDIYRALDFIYEHKSAIFNRIDKVMTSKYQKVTDYVFYDVTNFYFETEKEDDDLNLSDGSVECGLRQHGVSKENRKQPIVQMGLIMDKMPYFAATE